MMWSVFGRKYRLDSDDAQLMELMKLVDEGYEVLGTFNWMDHLLWLADFDPQGIRRPPPPTKSYYHSSNYTFQFSLVDPSQAPVSCHPSEKYSVKTPVTETGHYQLASKIFSNLLPVSIKHFTATKVQSLGKTALDEVVAGEEELRLEKRRSPLEIFDQIIGRNSLRFPVKIMHPSFGSKFVTVCKGDEVEANLIRSAIVYNGTTLHVLALGNRAIEAGMISEKVKFEPGARGEEIHVEQGKEIAFSNRSLDISHDKTVLVIKKLYSRL
ncbi:hypothetical protein LXL04_010192 [Taraxacum kok-saghyz]